MFVHKMIKYYKEEKDHKFELWQNSLSGGSVANKLATYAAAASKPSISSLAFSERSFTSNPGINVEEDNSWEMMQFSQVFEVYLCGISTLVSLQPNYS